MTTLVIDESGDDFEDVHRYVIGAGVVLPAAGRLDVHVYAVVGSAPSRHDIEFLREKCLRELFRSVRQHAVDRVVIESRERSTRVIGQNRRDDGTLIKARHAGELPASVRYEWVPKNEPLVWLADADAGAVLASERGDADWLSEATCTVVVRLSP